MANTPKSYPDWQNIPLVNYSMNGNFTPLPIRQGTINVEKTATVLASLLYTQEHHAQAPCTSTTHTEHDTSLYASFSVSAASFPCSMARLFFHS